MKKLFKGFYSKTNEEFNILWENCLFIVDANVLLNFYRYPKQVSEELFSVFDSIKDRLWLPHQAALEFHRNRLRVIAEQRKKFDTVKSILSNTQSQLRNQLLKLELKKRHSSIETDSLLEEIDKLINNFNENLDTLQSEHPDIFEIDNVLERIDDLFSERIGSPFQKKEIEEIYIEAKERFSKHIPPGYEDRNKENQKEGAEFLYGGILYNRAYSDLVLWKQIIAKAKDDGYSYIIFITDDLKEDWWRIIELNGKKRLGPRPELIEEISREGKVSIFHMYNSERFTKYANTYLDIVVSSESLDQLRDIHQTEISRNKAVSKYPLQMTINPDFREMTAIDKYVEKAVEKAAYLKNTKEEAKGILKQWFYENYEDPANSCPYESREGGYQYIWGGPYSAGDELFHKFGHYIDEDLLDEVTEEIEEKCIEWSGIPRDF